MPIRPPLALAMLVAFAATCSACAPAIAAAPLFTSRIGPDLDQTHYPCRFAHALEDRGPITPTAALGTSEPSTSARASNTTVSVFDPQGREVPAPSGRATRTTEGSLISAESRDGGLVISRVSSSGVSEDVLVLSPQLIETLPERGALRSRARKITYESSQEYGVVATEDAGTVVTVFAMRRRLGFASSAAPGVVVALAHRDAEIAPHALLASPDGYWLVARAAFANGRRSYTPPEWRFIHLAADGSQLGEARARFDRDPATGGLRVEAGELRFTLRNEADADPHEIAVVPNGACPPSAASPCARRGRLRPAASPSPARGPAAPSESPAFTCTASPDSLSIADARGHAVWTRAGGFHRCELALLPERFVVVASSPAVASGGPLDVTIYVVARDTLTLVAQYPNIVRNLDVDVMADAEGAAIGWMHVADYDFVRLDPLGALVGSARTLGALYYEARTEIRSGPDGPTLHWETSDVEGEIPFCSLDAVE